MLRSEKDIQELLELARLYCEVRAAFQYARAEGRLSAEDEESATQRLECLNRKLELLKSNNELDHRRARTASAIIPLARFRRKVAR